MSIRPKPAGSRDSTRQKRLDMVERTLVARDIDDPAVLPAMREVPRESFLPAELAEFAYVDAPLPIAEAQTISQPYIVALMAQALELQPGDRVLEIGSGSGYAAAILGRIASRVVTLERHRALAEGAANSGTTTSRSTTLMDRLDGRTMPPTTRSSPRPRRRRSRSRCSTSSPSEGGSSFRWGTRTSSRRSTAFDGPMQRGCQRRTLAQCSSCRS